MNFFLDMPHLQASSPEAKHLQCPCLLRDWTQNSLRPAQDTESAVRRCMGDQLPVLAQALGREVTCARILPEIFDLAEDEDLAVCCSAVAALSSIAHLLTLGMAFKRFQLLTADARCQWPSFCSAFLGCLMTSQEVRNSADPLEPIWVPMVPLAW